MYTSWKKTCFKYKKKLRHLKKFVGKSNYQNSINFLQN